MRLVAKLGMLEFLLALNSSCESPGTYRIDIVLPDENARSTVTEIELWALKDAESGCDLLMQGKVFPAELGEYAHQVIAYPIQSNRVLANVPQEKIICYAEGHSGKELVLRGCTEVNGPGEKEITVYLNWIPVCEPDDTQPCICPDNRSGMKSCQKDGTRWGDCLCSVEAEEGEYTDWLEPEPMPGEEELDNDSNEQDTSTDLASSHEDGGTNEDTVILDEMAGQDDNPGGDDGPAVTVFTFVPLADAYVNSTYPANNYGTATMLRADGSPEMRSYLRFNVQGLTGFVTRATLRLFANSASSQGYEIHDVHDGTWGEMTITYANAPPVDETLGSSGSVGAATWTSVDLTSQVVDNGSYNLAITTLSSTAISLASRDSGANAPQLIIETAP